MYKNTARFILIMVIKRMIYIEKHNTVKIFPGKVPTLICTRSNSPIIAKTNVVVDIIWV